MLIHPAPHEFDNEEIVNFIYNSQKIEGCKLTLDQTRSCITNYEKFVHDNIDKDFDPIDAVETFLHFHTILGIIHNDSKIDFKKYMISAWHLETFHATKPKIAGHYRSVDVGTYNLMGKFVPYMSHKVVSLAMKGLEEWIKKYEPNGKKGAIDVPTFAFKVHSMFEDIHPYEDGNGRVGRLLMNYFLIKHDYPIFDIKYEWREEYINSLEKGRFHEWACGKYNST